MTGIASGVASILPAQRYATSALLKALAGDIWLGFKRTFIPFKLFQAATEPLPEDLRSQIRIGNPVVSDMRNDLRYFPCDCDNRLVSGRPTLSGKTMSSSDHH